MNTYILEKRTTESILYDLDCTNILDSGETISTVTTIESDQTGLTFGTPVVNTQPITFSDGTVAAIGKVISVRISEGVIPSGAVNQIYTIRAIFNTSESNIREATVLMNVTNIPIQTGRTI